MMTTRAWSGRRSDPGMQDGVLADLDERLELFIHPRIDAGVGVVLEQLLPFLIRHPIGGPRVVPLPAADGLRGGEPGTVEIGSGGAAGGVGDEMVPPPANRAARA